jgi:hypothetical protein
LTLPDYPRTRINWETGLASELLRALGNLAVASAHAEELLHQIYWHQAGLDERTGPIVTDILNPKRLGEDIKKLVALDPTKANALADLKVLLKEFETLNTKRNHCLHWIWEAVERQGDITIASTQKQPLSVKETNLQAHRRTERRIYC